MSKRILIVGQHFWPESFRINDIADFFANDRGYSVEVLCGLPNYPSGHFPDGYGFFKKRRQVYNNITIRRVLEIPRGNNSNFRIFLNYISFPIASLFHVPYLVTKKYDKIFIYQLSPVMMSIAGILLGKLTRTETTMYVLDLWPENLYSVLDIKNPIMRKVAASVSHWHYRRADKLIALSETMKEKLINVTGISPHKITVIPQAAEKLYEIPIEDKLLEERFSPTFNVLFTGNISPAQSFETMIQAAKNLHNKGLKDIRWIIVGDGMSRKSVEKDVKDNDLGEIFIFEGQKSVEDIPKYTNIADVLVGCLVKSELLEATIPAKVMSYIASGKPIALAMDGEVKHLINNEIRCGFVGPTSDAEALAGNIEKIYLAGQTERELMGRRAKEYHFTHFERNLMLRKMETFMFNLSRKVE